jgi:predicted TIM-barrel fold metal-dependent hydrolase
MILDCHVHLANPELDTTKFAASVKSAGVDGAVLISMPPACFPTFKGPKGASERLDHALAWARSVPNSYAFFWIDPTEPDAAAQVKLAVEKKIDGFKIIANHFYPGDPKCIDVCRLVAQAGKPMLFHSGILWDGTASSKFCRPVEFEALIEVPKLRFALAHISWPWIDECLAVYGKFQNGLANRPELSCEMFIDTTPGTPPIYRKEALTKIWTIGYNVENNVLFGSDSTQTWYGQDWVPPLISGDTAIYESLGLKPEVREKIFSGNLKRFIGK